MQSIKTIPPKEAIPGIMGSYVHGAMFALGNVEVKKESILPEPHLHEQITLVPKGPLDMITGGVPCLLTAGIYHFIPFNVLHSATAPADCRMTDIFSPNREDYKTRGPRE